MIQGAPFILPSSYNLLVPGIPTLPLLKFCKRCTEFMKSVSVPGNGGTRSQTDFAMGWPTYVCSILSPRPCAPIHNYASYPTVFDVSLKVFMGVHVWALMYRDITKIVVSE